MNKARAKKVILINTIDLSSTDYIARLFSIFDENSFFCFQENKCTECFICDNKIKEVVNELHFTPLLTMII